MTPEAINMRIAEYFWPGIMTGKDYAKRPTDYYGSNAAMDLLDVLVERGYSPCLYWCIGNKWSIELYFDGDYVLGVSKETIPTAICHAIIELIEREGGL